MGSTFAARRAGSQQANSATAIESNNSSAKVSGSDALTPKSKFRMTLVH